MGGAVFCIALLKAVFAFSRQEPEAPFKDSSEASSCLRWMGHWKGEGSREQLVRDVLEDFSFLHPQIDVQFEFAADVLPVKSQQNAARLIAEMIRSGTISWDVVWLDPLIYYLVAQELDDWNWGHKHLVDFSEVEGFAECHKSFVADGKDAYKHTAGVCTGPYIEGFYYTVWYNKETADRLGIEVKEIGMSEQDLLDYVDKVRIYNQTVEEPVAAFLDYSSAGPFSRLYYSLLFSAFQAEECLEWDAGKVASVQKSIRELFCKLAQGGPALVLETEHWPDAGRALVEGKALFFFDATWRYNAFEQIDPNGLKKLRLAQMPEYQEHSHVIGGFIPTWAVMKNAAGRDAGIALLKYWSRPAIAEQWIRLTKCPTGLKGSLYDPRFGHDVYAEYQRRLEEGIKHRISDPLMFRNSLIENGLEQGSNGIARTVDIFRKKELVP